MGPNGSGKTTLAYALMGHPAYVVKSGEVLWQGHEPAQALGRQAGPAGHVPGLPVPDGHPRPVRGELPALGHQRPPARPEPGSRPSTPRTPFRGGIPMGEFRKLVKEKMALLQMDESIAARYVNEGFSGGEKKRLEMLQMAVLEPEMAILDETDSGLDIDALRIVAEGVNAMLNPNMGVLVITHYQRLLDYITPDTVHVLAAGRIITSGGKDLALRLEEEGYAPILAAAGLEAERRRRSARRGRRAGDGGRPLGRADDGRTLDHAGVPTTAAAPTAARAGRLDPRRLRADFPILATANRLGKPLVYLDSRRHAASSRAPSSRPWTATTASTPRTSTAASTRSPSGPPPPTKTPAPRSPGSSTPPRPREIVFVRNATEAINLVAYSWGRRNIGRGDTIVLTEMEHHANLVPWQLLVQEKDGDLEFVPITDDGMLRLEVYEALLHLRPKLVAFTHVSNMLGTINPVREMTEMAHAAGALVLIDGAQAVPHMPVDVQAIGADFYVFSGHKMLAPTGSGALWARRELLEAMPPFLAGGDMIREVHLRRIRVERHPARSSRPARRTSPPQIGMGAAAEYLMALGMDAVRAHEQELAALRPGDAAARGPRHRAVRPGRGPARRRRVVQPAGHPPPRRGPDPRPLRDLHPGRPPLHDAAPRALRPGGHGPGQLQRLHHPRGDRRPGGRPARSRPHLRPRARQAGLGILDPMDDLYRDYILEHYRRPHNFGVLDDADGQLRGLQPALRRPHHDDARHRRRRGARGRLHRPRLRHQPGQRVAADRRDQGQDGRRGREADARRPARPDRHRDQPGPPQVRPALARHGRPRPGGRRPQAGRGAGPDSGLTGREAGGGRGSYGMIRSWSAGACRSAGGCRWGGASRPQASSWGSRFRRV